MANYTPNYQLHQWQPEDPFLRTDFNADLAKIDTALGKHDQLTAAHEVAIPKLGNCKIFTASYVGTGTCGEDNPTTVTFPWTPQFAIIIDSGQFMLLTSGCTWGVYFASNFGTGNTVSWSGTTASWYTTDNTDPGRQLNRRNSIYLVIAFAAKFMDE